METVVPKCRASLKNQNNGQSPKKDGCQITVVKMCSFLSTHGDLAMQVSQVLNDIRYIIETQQNLLFSKRLSK